MFIKIKNNKKGFTLIEGLVALLIFSILVVTFYKIFTGTMTHMQDVKYRRGAVALANERMEQFRNLAYEDVATKANAPVGDIEDDEIVNVNGLVYRIITSVFFVDDPADGTAAASTDDRYEDYKRVSVVVLWDSAVSADVSKSDALNKDEYSSKRITIVSQFVPPGGLEAMPTGGILSVNVLDSEAEPVTPISGAIVTIIDNACGTTGHPDCSENPIISQPTDSTGNFMYIGAPICADCYEIKITKSSYETRQTRKPFIGDDGDGTLTQGEYNPTYVHQGVSAGNITTITFNTNKISQLKITSKDPFGNLIGDVGFDIEGGEVIGTTSDTGEDVYSLNATEETTDATNADVDIYSDANDTYASAGLYQISNIVLPTGHTNDVFWKLTPTYNDRYQIDVGADENKEVNITILDNDYDGAFIRVMEDSGEVDVFNDPILIPVEGVSVQLQNTTLSPAYDVTLVTDEFGYVYFPENKDEDNDGNIDEPLVNDEDYDIIIPETDDYNSVNDSITVDGLTQKEVEIVKK